MPGPNEGDQSVSNRQIEATASPDAQDRPTDPLGHPGHVNTLQLEAANPKSDWVTKGKDRFERYLSKKSSLLAKTYRLICEEPHAIFGDAFTYLIYHQNQRL
jgi:hypothetical protein